jgi:hypothetical protein
MRDDEGSVMLLTLGFVVVSLLLVLVVTAATQVHLQRMRLARVADELAIDAADALDVAGYYAGELPEPGEEGVVALSNTALGAIVDERLPHAAARADLPETVVVEALSEDGFTATVTVRTVVHPLFGLDALLPFSDGVTLTATSSARAY